jgi:DNA-binding PadR family transcriptional regulator
MNDGDARGLSTLDYHVLVAMAEEPRHGYAIKDAVERESGGTLSPRAGSLYRVLARLMTHGLVQEVDGAPDDSPHPGRARRYYGLSAEGRSALAAEARRLKEAAALAEERLGIIRRRT